MSATTPTLNHRFRALLDWTVLLVGVSSLAFAILASSTGLVSADDTASDPVTIASR